MTGSAHGDTLTGDADANRLFGFEGDDRLDGGAGDDILVGGAGADTLNGGTGVDTANYFWSGAAVTVNLATGTGAGGHAQGDSLSSIENLVGSDHNDSLTGGDGDNRLFGGAGDDSLNGGAGNDIIDGGAGNEFIDGGLGDDEITLGTGSDLISMSGGFGNDTVNGFTTGDGAEGDYLDFSAYMAGRPPGEGTSPYSAKVDFNIDSAPGSGDLDNDLSGLVDVNEVVVVRMAGTSAQTFDGLDNNDVGSLFVSADGSNDYADLDDASFGLAFYQDGAFADNLGTAVMMFEDAADLGYYKVSGLTWNTFSGDNFGVFELGSLDFGDTLTGLVDANIFIA